MGFVLCLIIEISIVPASRTSSLPPPTQSPKSSAAVASPPPFPTVGIIVGAVVGVIAVVLLGLMLLLYRRSRRATNSRVSPSWEVDHTPPATPFPSRGRGLVPPTNLRAKSSIIARDTNTASYTFASESRMYEGENPSSKLTTSAGASNTSSLGTLAIHRESVKPVASPKSHVDDPPPLYVP
jgi:hypothetical protein